VNTEAAVATRSRIRPDVRVGEILGYAGIWSFFIIFLIYPLTRLFYDSFTTDDGIFTLGNYYQFFTDGFYLRSFYNSMVLGVACVITTSVLGIAIAFLLMWPFRSIHFYTNRFSWVPAAILFLLGFSIYRAAFKTFDRAKVSGLAELEPDRHRQQLITTGIRARVRHPIYLGHLCEIAGWCIGTGLVTLYALAAFAVITGAVMIRMEDRELEARFGEAFRGYRQRVPGVLPRVRKN